MRRPAFPLPPAVKRRFPDARGVVWSRFVPEVLICMGAIALSYGLRLIAFLH